jgi:hypothetical protein
MIVPRGSPTQLAGGRIIRRPWRGFRGVRRGLGSVSPVGFPDFASFQTAVIASYPACPPPFDPACENPRDAAIAADLETWKTTPGSCGVIVCDAAGNAAPGSTTSGSTASGSSMPTHTSHGFQNPFASSSSTTTSSTAPAPFGYWAAGGTRPAAGNPVVPFYGPRTPIQSASPASAPGGSSAPATAPTPVQTQTPPACDPTTDPTCPGYQTPGFSLSSIPWWGWGLGVVGLILITRPAGRR